MLNYKVNVVLMSKIYHIQDDYSCTVYSFNANPLSRADNYNMSSTWVPRLTAS